MGACRTLEGPDSNRGGVTQPKGVGSGVSEICVFWCFNVVSVVSDFCVFFLFVFCCFSVLFVFFVVFAFFVCKTQKHEKTQNKHKHTQKKHKN